MWTYAIKANAILALLSVVMLISGSALGDVAQPVINWVDEYSDNEENKGLNNEYQNNQNDILLHMSIATGAYELFFWMTMGAYIWAWSFLKIRDAGDDFECEIKPQDYSALPGVVANITDK
jgi:hypothetical protein